jgi:hypothetical protein
MDRRTFLGASFGSAGSLSLGGYTFMAAVPLLGFLRHRDRTHAQHEAHQMADASMVAFNLPIRKLDRGESIRLWDAWSAPEVVAEVGLTYTRIRQWTGSCVHSGGTNALFSTIAMQRLSSDKPTKAFLPFTWHNYALSRHYAGMDYRGSGSFGSTFARSLNEDGVRDWVVADRLPAYNTVDGISVANKDVELDWSTYRNRQITQVLRTSRDHLLGSAARCKTIADIRAMVTNGYGVSFACDCFIGRGEVRGSGSAARVMGKWDSDGGHQMSIHGVEEHEDLGPIYNVLNSWSRNTYPILPVQPVCSVWVTEADLETALTQYNSEVYGFSNLNWFPTNEAVPLIDWSKM